MKKFIFILILLTGIVSNAQFKDDSNTKIDLRSRMIKSPTSSFVLGFINPNNLTMNHSFSMSYSSFGGNGIALGVYTNSLFYKINDKANFILETSIVNSPYSTFGNASQSLNGIYISRAELNYKISKNSSFSIQFSNDPTRAYDPYYGSYYNDPWYNNLLNRGNDSEK